MNNQLTLCELVPGQRAVISGIVSENEGRRRLRELGMTDGETVECVLFRGGISAYLVKGSLIALRREDAEAVRTGVPVNVETAMSKGGRKVWL